MESVLVIAPNGPEESFGGGQRNLFFIRAFQAKGFHVDLVVLLNEDWKTTEESSIVKKWRKEFDLVASFQIKPHDPFTPSLKVLGWLLKNISKYKYVIYRDQPTAWKAGFLFVQKSKNLIDYNDFLLPNTNDYQKLKYFPIHLVELLRIRKALCMDIRHMKYFKNKALFAPNFPLPLFDLKYKKAYTKIRSVFPSIIFVSSYLHFFIEFISHHHFDSIFEITGLRIFIVSRATTPEIKKQFNHPAFIWLDNVEDLSIYYSQAWISIVPGYKKDGPLIKLVESIYYKTPVVCSSDALIGYEFFNEKEILIPASNNKFEMIENIKTSLSDPSLLDEHSKKLYLIMQKHFSFEDLVVSLPS